jgi:hypothetical protein
MAYDVAAGVGCAACLMVRGMIWCLVYNACWGWQVRVLQLLSACGGWRGGRRQGVGHGLVYVMYCAHTRYVMCHTKSEADPLKHVADEVAAGVKVRCL